MTPPTTPAPADAPAGAVPAYVTGLADDALVLAQRLSEWVSRGPQLEEDVALANIALDLLGQARTMLTYAGRLEGAGRDEDALAYLREERGFRNVQLVEIPNGDFAVTMARQLVFSAYQVELYTALQDSSHATLGAVAGKAVKEVTYHLDHARQWVVRLGDGTEESHRRMQAGLDAVWPYVDELFVGGPGIEDVVAAGVGVDPAALRPAVDTCVRSVLAEATLEVPTPTWTARGGRRGIHSEHLGYLLAEMQYLHRCHPGASW